MFDYWAVKWRVKAGFTLWPFSRLLHRLDFDMKVNMENQMMNSLVVKLKWHCSSLLTCASLQPHKTLSSELLLMHEFCFAAQHCYLLIEFYWTQHLNFPLPQSGAVTEGKHWEKPTVDSARHFFLYSCSDVLFRFTLWIRVFSEIQKFLMLVSPLQTQWSTLIWWVVQWNGWEPVKEQRTRPYASSYHQPFTADTSVCTRGALNTEKNTTRQFSQGQRCRRASNKHVGFASFSWS